MKCSFPICEHEVYRFVMPVIESNMYVLVDSGEALIVDPCISAEAEALLRENNVQNCLILLTHEHYDHISGVNRLRAMYDCEVVCTASCAANISNPKSNAAALFVLLFLERDAETWRCVQQITDRRYACTADRTYTDAMSICWHGLCIGLRQAPGHSPGSQIIRIAERFVFTGDSLIPDADIITRLPGGNRTDYERETLPLLQALPQDSVIYPGHGEPISLTSMER